MNEFADNNGSDKSCWSVTGWALAAALVVSIFGTILAGSDTTEVTAVTEPAS